MSYKAIDVARHVINFTNLKDQSISNLKLQKILYFLQGFYFSEFNEELFEDEIEAWAYGPVVRDVYVEFCQHGSSAIPTVKVVENYKFVSEDGKLKITKYTDRFFDNVIKQTDKDFLDQVTEELFGYSAASLVQQTHEKGPWKQYYREGEKCIIPKGAIKNYFKNS